MSFKKYLLPALAALGTASAASSSCSGTSTIQNSGDAATLSACSTFSGDIVVATQAAGTLTIPGIQEITGSLTADSAAQLSALEADSLKTIGQDFKLSNLTIIANLNFPQLTSVGGLEWVALPALQTLNFAATIQEAGNVLITDTQLSSLDGINLQMVDNFNINNNRFLKSIEVQLGNITQSLNIEANGMNLTASFPNLEWAYNMTFRNCSGVKTPSLATVNGSMGFYSNYFTDYAAPNLTSTGGSLVFVSNEGLTNISLPMLKTIGGGYQIANNTKLSQIDGFTKLATVAGAIDFSGNFTSVALPALNDVRGGFNMQSSGQLDCSQFDKDHSNQVIKGTYTCKGLQAHPQTKGSGSSSGGSSTSSGTSPSSTGKKSAAGRFEVNVAAVMGLSMIAGLLLSSF
ncbi:hypothetical protein L228DRAFT_236746 [Xylona heveae TC161]|uniref:GPI-anchored cell wall organization protein Ecm33 n=1 Tax=Xylona heveae (strain CBS 132557 / TC161) TaxID=1328760 RepID=A0A165J3A7_XYLHT|nr:hypothetical protein L228DRAFT_236746 [Xylona heveae TC161]KZF25673.1 hypothetical protein L228DRAFT_236746 [Xylona heveae TC161]